MGSNRMERQHFQVYRDWFVHGSNPSAPQVICADALVSRRVSPPISKLENSTLGFNMLQPGFSWDHLSVVATPAGARASRRGTWPMRRGPLQSCRSWRRRSFRRKSAGNPWGLATSSMVSRNSWMKRRPLFSPSSWDLPSQSAV